MSSFTYYCDSGKEDTGMDICRKTGEGETYYIARRGVFTCQQCGSVLKLRATCCERNCENCTRKDLTAGVQLEICDRSDGSAAGVAESS